MESNATFIFADREIEPMKTQGKIDDKIGTFIERLKNKISINLNDFDFYYNGKTVNRDCTISKIKNIKNSKDIEITVRTKEKVMKCPSCICNNCVIKVQNYKLSFNNCCRHPFHKEVRILDEYENSQRIDYKQISCHKCKRSLSKYLDDFYKCFNCSQLVGSAYYYCKRCTEEHIKLKSHKAIKYDEKFYYCRDHFNKYISYCKKCQINLCDICEKEHKKGHEIIRYGNPDTKPIKEDLEKIRSNTEDLKIIVEQIKNMLDGAVNLMEKYYIIAKDIIGKYENYNKALQNFQVIESVNNLSRSNLDIMADLKNIISGNKSNEDWIKKCIVLIGIFKGDRDFYTNKNIFKSDEEDFNQEDNSDEEEIETNLNNAENNEYEEQNANYIQLKSKSKFNNNS